MFKATGESVLKKLIKRPTRKLKFAEVPTIIRRERYITMLLLHETVRIRFERAM